MYARERMRVLGDDARRRATTTADTVVIGVFEGEEVAAPVLQALLERARQRRRGLARARPRRFAALAAREARNARAVEARGSPRVRRQGRQARRRAWREVAVLGAARRRRGRRGRSALVEGTILASYRFDRYKQEPNDSSERPTELDELIISAAVDISDGARERAGGRGGRERRADAAGHAVQRHDADQSRGAAPARSSRSTTASP